MLSRASPLRLEVPLQIDTLPRPSGRGSFVLGSGGEYHQWRAVALVGAYLKFGLKDPRQRVATEYFRGWSRGNAPAVLQQPDPVGITCRQVEVVEYTGNHQTLLYCQLPQ